MSALGQKAYMCAAKRHVRSHDAVRAYGRRNHLVFKARSEMGGIDLAQIAIRGIDGTL
jgi:hypothetical protein